MRQAMKAIAHFISPDLQANLPQYAKLPGVQVEIADTARHFIMYDQPDLFVQEVRTFLAGAPRSSGERG